VLLEEGKDMQEQCDASSEPEDYARSMDNIICPTMSATG